MADTKPSDFSTTAADNATVGGINIAEGSQAAQLNDAIRAVLAVIANPDFGTLSFKADAIAESTPGSGTTLGGLLASSYLRLTGVISPTQIAAAQNDYAPAGHAAASVFRLSSDASRTITGLAGGTEGRVVILHNVGSNDIVLSDADTGSTAANRFALVESITLEADGVAVLQYDNTSSRWRALAQPAQEITLPAAPTIQVITASGTWTKPTGCKAARVRAQGGGGGGGGGGAAATQCGGGGAGGGYAEKLIDVTAIASSTVTIGAAGAAGTTTGNGGAGGATSWADGTNTLTASGGAGGLDGAGDEYSRAAGGAASGGDFNVAGGNGGANGAFASSFANWGDGGSSLLGHGGKTALGLAGENGTGYGAGGSGGSRDSTARAGGAGSAGVVIVEEFY